MSNLAIHEQPVILFAEECEQPIHGEENQVSVLHVGLALGELLLIADGAAGNHESALAARMVVEYFYTHLSSLPSSYPVERAIQEASEHANASLLVAASTPGSTPQGFRASLVVALLQQDGEMTHAWVGHIGDSRAYLLRAGRLHHLTVDHTVVQEMLDRKILTPFEAQHHPEAKVLTRSLGQRLAVEIEIEQVPLAAGDTLLLCSDSLWRTVPESEMQAAADSATVESAAHNLLAMALATGGGAESIGVEIARMIQPHGVRNHQAHHPIAMILVVTIFLLGLGGVIGLLWYLL
jgi:protein phosphatase